MFGMRHSGFDERWAGGRHWRRHGGGVGFGGRHGMGGGDVLRAGRMLVQGDLRLLALALIAERPRHGYEIIKVLEEKTAGSYSPRPGNVSPPPTHLQQVPYRPPQTEPPNNPSTLH